MSELFNKKIVLGITGGIAAYKTPEIVRLLSAQGVVTRCVLSAQAPQFVTPLTLQVVSQQPVYDTAFDPKVDHGMAHIQLAEWADAIVIAPASANCIAKLAHGLADDLLTTLILATPAPVFIFPAMNERMWLHPQTQANVAQCQSLGYKIFQPASGPQACGAMGPGRMQEPTDVIAQLTQVLTVKRDWVGLSCLITAGPTEEPIDPVRFISNRSSGKMGYALAEQAIARGATVTLVTGPTNLQPPVGANVVRVVTAEQMHQAVLNALPGHDIFISVAAVADYRCLTPQSHKLKKTAQTFDLQLVRNPDILTAVASKTSDRPFCVGFAAETDADLQHAQDKLHRKQCDMMVWNQVGGAQCPFGQDETAVTVITPNVKIPLARATKAHIANQLLTIVRASYDTKHTSQNIGQSLRERV